MKFPCSDCILLVLCKSITLNKKNLIDVQLELIQGCSIFNSYCSGLSIKQYAEKDKPEMIKIFNVKEY